MSEYVYLTLLLLAFSAYVVFENLESLCEKCRARRQRWTEMKATPSTAVTAEPTPAPIPEPPSAVETAAAPSAVAPVSTPTPAPPAPATPEPTQARATHLRDPATGEVAAIPSNYRFAKKWIKEALVAEGLLDRIYKPGELDEATSRRVKEAIERLCLLDKYRPR